MNKIITSLKEFITEQNSNNTYDITQYHVILNTDDSTDTLYYGDDYNKAKLSFDLFSDIPTEWINRTDVSVIFFKKVDKYKFIYQLDEDESIDDYPVEDYYDDKKYYKLVEESEFDTIDSRDIIPVNKQSMELLDDVSTYYKKKYGKFKYNTINIYDDDNDDNYLGCINLRVANHTENIKNVDRFGNCDYHISVVIADFDVTKQKFGMSNAFDRRRNEYLLEFNSDDIYDDIIEQVNDLIDEITQKIKE